MKQVVKKIWLLWYELQPVVRFAKIHISLLNQMHPSGLEAGVLGGGVGVSNCMSINAHAHTFILPCGERDVGDHFSL